MNSTKDDENYWNTTEKKGFSFEDDEEDQLFGVSKTGTARLRAGISSIDETDDYLKSDVPQSNLKPLLSVISEKTLNTILTADSLQDIREEKPLVQPDITLKRILLGQPFMLEQYKSLRSKTELLDAAIASGDGKAVLIVMIFIAKTLKQSLIERLLVDRPEAVNVYIRYLATTLRTSELNDLLKMFRPARDIAMINLQIIIKNTPHHEKLLQKLQKFFTPSFAVLPDCRETYYVQNYIKLLEWQKLVKPPEVASEKLEPHSSVLDCLRYLCKYHWGASEASLESASNFSKQHAVSPRQYQSVALSTRASMQAWADVESLLITKGWLGSKKLQTNLSIEEILKIFHDNKAPSSSLAQFLGYVDNLDKRLDMAKRLQCHQTVIDVLVLQKDRIALMDYKSSLHSQSEHYFYAEHALRASTIKWKN